MEIRLYSSSQNWNVSKQRSLFKFLSLFKQNSSANHYDQYGVINFNYGLSNISQKSVKLLQSLKCASWHYSLSMVWRETSSSSLVMLPICFVYSLNLHFVAYMYVIKWKIHYSLINTGSLYVYIRSNQVRTSVIRHRPGSLIALLPCPTFGWKIIGWVVTDKTNRDISGKVSPNGEREGKMQTGRYCKYLE